MPDAWKPHLNRLYGDPSRRRRLAAVLIALAIALAVTAVTVRDHSSGAATVRLIVAGTASEAGGGLPNVGAITEYGELGALNDRATLVAGLAASRAGAERIAADLGVQPDQVSVSARTTQSVPRSLAEPSFEVRAEQIVSDRAPFQLEAQSRPDLPVVDLYARAPTAAQAGELANAAVRAADDELRSLARKRGDPPGERLELTRIGEPRTGTIDPTATARVALLTFLVVFGLCLGLAAAAAGVYSGWRGRPLLAAEAAPRSGPSGGDWPRTTRLLPWSIAGFIALVWLVPFNTIVLGSSLPIDLTLDRLLLPAIAVLYLLALLAGALPGQRFGPVHVAVAIFAGAAFLSVVVNAGTLSETLALDLAIKKLALLTSYVAFFAIVAGVIRRREVWPFLNYTLGLAVLCSLGVIWEYRYGFNVFYDVSSRLLSGLFEAQPAPAGFDDLGRRAVTGPTDHGLELVAILSLALPISLVGLIASRGWRGRILYGAAAVIVGVAAISTYRKSALLAPAAVVVSLICLEPRGLRRLVPLALGGILLLPLVSFSAFGSVTGQFQSHRLTASTVGDRVADYDAIRPDVLSKPVLGRGFGSYENASEPATARVLDSDLLLRLVESGVLGLAAFVTMIAGVVVAALPAIRSGDRDRAPPALAIGAGASSFLVLAFLFDEWSFPHAPYVFLTMAALLAVVIRDDPEPAPAPGR